MIDWKTYYVDPRHEAALLASDPISRSTPTPDERAVAPELVERMIALVKNCAEGYGPLPTLEARAIVAALEPVDRVEAKRLADIWEINEEAAYQILARGRQLEKEGK